MTLDKQKEELSISYLSSIAAVAGIDYERNIHDSDSTDATLKCWIDGIHASLRVQLKATSSSNVFSESENTISYKLKPKNYNDLCAKSTTPIILCLLILPEDPSEWLSWSIEELSIKGIMYWVSLAGRERTDNTSSISISISKNNTITKDSLIALLKQIAEDL
ncbi:MAG: DUF4365 domain-containing protein [Oscillospiraceae bacterium]|nr:DUF4365 domain-containing protein [Oscillospiraceae bacterium]